VQVRALFTLYANRILSTPYYLVIVSPYFCFTLSHKSEYEDDEVEKVYDTIEEILEEDGRGHTNSRRKL
jgi:hypothetical protein